MEFNENNISTIVSMIVPFLAYVITKLCGFDIDQAMLTMFITGIIELIILIWSAKNPNTMKIFGNETVEPVTDYGVLNDEYVTGDDDEQ